MTRFIKAIGWGAIMAGFSSITFIGSFIFLKYAPEEVKAGLAFSYSLYSYLGGLLGLLFYNGFKLTDEALGEEVRFGALAKVSICTVGVLLSEKIVFITNIIRIGLARQGVVFELSVIGLLIFLGFFMGGVLIFFVQPAIAWRYFYCWLSILPVLGMFAFLSNKIWLPVKFIQVTDKVNICWKVFRRMIFDVALVVSPIFFLLTAKISLDPKEQVVYFQCVSAFGVCGIFSMILESFILKKGSALNVHLLKRECFFWLFTAFLCFLILYLFFGVFFFIALCGAAVSFFLMMGGSVVARMRLKKHHGIFIRQGILVAALSMVICGVILLTTANVYFFLAAVLINSILNVTCYWWEILK